MNNFNQAFAKRLKYYLDHKNISQYSIWQNTGIYPSTINAILNAKCKSMNSRTMTLIIMSCGVSFAEFFDDDLFDYDKLIVD